MELGNTLIIGDSYSTFEGNIPQGYEFWFGKERRRIGETDVEKVEQTWWFNLFDGEKNILLRNESFSGTTVCNSVRPEHTVEMSFISRFDKLVEDGFFSRNKVDTVFVFGFTNDSWTNTPIGEILFEDYKSQDLLKALPACGYLGAGLNKVAPNAHICWLINTELKEEIVNGIIKTAEHFGQDYIRFTELDKITGHPSILGMQQIASAVREHF